MSYQAFCLSSLNCNICNSKPFEDVRDHNIDPWNWEQHGTAQSHPKSGWWSLSLLSTPSSAQPCPTSPALWLRYGPPPERKMFVLYLRNSNLNFKNMSQEPFGINLSKRFKKASLAVPTSAGPIYAKEEARDLKKTVVWWCQEHDFLNKW